MRISDWSSDVCSSDLFQNERVEELSRRHGELMEKAVEKAAEVAQQIGADLERKITALEQAVTRAGGEATRIGTSFAESARSEERRVGKEGVSTCRSRWSADHLKKKTNET